MPFHAFHFTFKAATSCRTFPLLLSEANKSKTLKTPWLRCGRNPQDTFCFSGEESKLSSCGRVFVETTLILIFFCGSVCEIPKPLSVIGNSHWSGDNKNRNSQSILCNFVMLFCCCCQLQGPILKLSELPDSWSSILLLKKNQ